MKYEFVALVEWRDKVIIGEKFFPLTLCLPQIRHSLPRERNRAFAVRGRTNIRLNCRAASEEQKLSSCAERCYLRRSLTPTVKSFGAWNQTLTSTECRGWIR